MALSRSSGARLTAAEKKLEIMRLRRDGYTFREIGQELNCTPQYCHRVITECLEKLATKYVNAAAQLRELEAERLDRAHRAAWPKAIKGDLRAIDRVLKIMERRAKLYGLDAPQKRELTGKDGTPLGGGGLASLLAEAQDDD